MTESPQQRIARIFGMGKYGEKLARDILAEYREVIAEYLDEDGYHLAAQVVRDEEWEHDV